MTPSPPMAVDGTAGPSLVLIGASTGGVRALGTLFDHLPSLNAAVVLVQHMPAYIQASFVKSLGKRTRMRVELAGDGDWLEAGGVWVAPAGVHCTLVQNRRIRLVASPKVHYVCPAVDVTMLSVVPCRSPSTLAGVVLTGMGRDGADGLVHLKRMGARTVAQDEGTCSVFGMPKEAWIAGGTDLLLPPERIAQRLAGWVGTL